MGGLDLPGGHVVDDGVAEDVVRRVGGLHVPGGPAEDDGQLVLVVQPLRQTCVALNEALRRHGLADPLGEVHGDGPLLGEGAVVVGGLGQVVPVVHAQADDVLPGPGDGSAQDRLRRRHRSARALCRAGGREQVGEGSRFDEGIHIGIGQGEDGGAVRSQGAHALDAVILIRDKFHENSSL